MRGPGTAGAAAPGGEAARRGRRLWALALLAATIAAGAEQEIRPLRTGGVGTEAAALLLSGQEGGSIPLFALALAGVATADGKAAVELFVEAPGEAILAGHRHETLRLDLCLYALADSRVIDSSLETVELDLERDRQLLLAGGLKTRSTLELAAGEYVLRVLLLNVQTRELGLRSFPLAVRAADAGPHLQPPLVPDPEGAWLRLSRQAGPPATGFWPAARPVLAPDRDTELEVLVRGLEPGAARVVLSGAGGDSLELPTAIEPLPGPAPAGFERWQMQTRLPFLNPGNYELGLQADAAASPRLPIVVRPDGRGVWADRGTLPAAGVVAEPSLPTVGDKPARRRERAALARRLADEYRGALGRLVATDMPGAVEELTRLEAAAFATEGGAAAVTEAELETARALARATDGTLVPLFELHYHAYRLYLSGQRFRLSSHARDRLLDLVDLHLAYRPGEIEPAVDILVMMANQLQRSGLVRYSAVLFRRALDVDPAHQGALLGLAAGLEKHGEYHQACDFLEQLLAVHPEHREGRLRLAVNLARTHGSGRARDLLTGLVAADERDWVTAVAHQELARDLIHRDLLAEAERHLIAARERLPEDEQLSLLLAAVRDTRRAGAEADERLALRSRADQPSARHRYQEWPRFTPRSAGDRRERQLEALAAALSQLRGEA